MTQGYKNIIQLIKANLVERNDFSIKEKTCT